MDNLEKKYSVLGGVVAPKSSAYKIQGMPNPLAEVPTKKLDTSLPSLRDNGATSRFNDFNPYGGVPKRSPEMINNAMAMQSNRQKGKYVVNVNTFQPTGSPMLPDRFKR